MGPQSGPEGAVFCSLIRELVGNSGPDFLKMIDWIWSIINSWKKKSIESKIFGTREYATGFKIDDLF